MNLRRATIALEMERRRAFAAGIRVQKFLVRYVPRQSAFPPPPSRPTWPHTEERNRPSQITNTKIMSLRHKCAYSKVPRSSNRYIYIYVIIHSARSIVLLSGMVIYRFGQLVWHILQHIFLLTLCFYTYATTLRSTVSASISEPAVEGPCN